VLFVDGLRCRECGRSYPAEALHVCEFCFGPLEVAYDYEAIAAAVTRESVAAGPPTIWRYAALLPAQAEGAVDLGAGCTPLVRADRLAAELGLGELWIKNDRMKTNERIPSDLEQQKVITTAVYGTTLVAIDGTYDEVNRLCAELTSDHPSWAFVNVNVRTYYAEGSKTLAFEVAEQLGWRAPDHVVVPIASGSQLTKIHKGFQELHRAGLLDEPPATRVSGAQAAGCAPVATAFAEGHDFVRPVRPHTIAKSLAIGNPADGPYALDVVRATGGAIGAVSDTEIVEGIRLLARTEGIFAETAGGVTIATLARLAGDGVVRRDERVVAFVTGNGLKTLDAVAGVVGPTATIKPTLEAFAAAVDTEGPSA